MTEMDEDKSEHVTQYAMGMMMERLVSNQGKIEMLIIRIGGRGAPEVKLGEQQVEYLWAFIDPEQRLAEDSERQGFTSSESES